MSTGLARASVRSRPSAFAGTFAVLVFSATVVTACVSIAVSAADAPVSPEQSSVSEMSVAFTLLTVYMSIYVIGHVMSLAVAQRRRESALLRAVGAGPWQIRRMVMTEALCTALLSLPVGYGLGALLARMWFDGMAGQGMIPPDLSLSVGWPPLLAAAGVLLVSSQLGGVIAAWRASRTRPSTALAEAQVQGSERTGVIRALLSVVCLIGAGAMTTAAGSGPAEDATEVVPLVLLAHLVAIGFAGPWIGRLATAVGAPLLRGPTGELAVAGSRARARRLSSAITPIALVTAFALAKFVSLAGVADPDWMEVFGTLLYAGFAGLVAANTLVMLTLERLREFSLLRVVGAENRQVLAVVAWEGCLTALAGLGAGAFAGCAVMIPLGAKTGTPVTGLPAWAWGATLACGLALVLAASCAPLIRMLRIRPIAGVTRRSA